VWGRIDPILRKEMRECGMLNRGEASISINIADQWHIMCLKEVARWFDPLVNSGKI
jgi:hypothetical protein